MEKELAELLKKLESITFSGRSNYYPLDAKDGYLKMEYGQKKLIVRNKSPLYDNESVIEIGYNENYDVIFYKESIGDVQKDLTNQIKKHEEYGILNLYLEKDPRWSIKKGKSIEKVDDKSYRIKVLEGKIQDKPVSLYIELELENGILKRMNRSLCVEEWVKLGLARKYTTREIESQRSTTEFSY
ncbi:MAG TPA: hypothetical protein VJH34_01000 [archaeon]|nr:hypothetical protein [archaeon]